MSDNHANLNQEEKFVNFHVAGSLNHAMLFVEG